MLSSAEVIEGAPSAMSHEFQEIAHAGGKVTFSIKVDDQGGTSYQVGYSYDRPGPITLIAVYALPQGIPVDSIQLGGLGQPWNPAPYPQCFPVFIASDSERRFGHNCPYCRSYWRSGPWPNICPYCARRAPHHEFLSDAQLRYVKHYCNLLVEALESNKDRDVVLNMDEVTDAVNSVGEKPSFYVTEKSQQRQFSCGECGEFNDILGRYGFCSLCGTRSDLSEFETESVPCIRDQLNSGVVPEDCLRSAVAAFDSFAAQMSKTLTEMVPMTPHRRQQILKQRFYKIREVSTKFKNCFDIDPAKDMTEEELHRVDKMFCRRHVYEHNGGEVDQRYLDESGDTTVSLKQRLHETKHDVHQFLSSLTRVARNLHGGFHDLFPALSEPIEAHRARTC